MSSCGDTKSDAHEALCTNCGKCCYKKIIIGRTVYITPFPCEYLNTDTNMCTIYDRRHELNPYCLNVEDAIKHNSFPADCPYVEEQAPPRYRAAREDLDWPREFEDFDSLADDLDVSPEVREKVRLRGPAMPPMYVEAYEKILAQRAKHSETFPIPSICAMAKAAAFSSRRDA